MNQELPLTDRELLAAAGAGDGESFTLLFDRHRDRIFRHSYSLVRNAADAEDITAMVFYEAWRKRAKIRLVSDSVLPWLLVTANYTVSNQRRQQHRYRRFLAELPAPEHSPDIAETVIELDSLSWEQRLIRAAFQQLPAQSRDILTLCVLEEIPAQEAAQLLKIPVGTVKSRLSRAKRKLGLIYQHTEASFHPAPCKG